MAMFNVKPSTSPRKHCSILLVSHDPEYSAKSLCDYLTDKLSNIAALNDGLQQWEVKLETIDLFNFHNKDYQTILANFQSAVRRTDTRVWVGPTTHGAWIGAIPNLENYLKLTIAEVRERKAKLAATDGPLDNSPWSHEGLREEGMVVRIRTGGHSPVIMESQGQGLARDLGMGYLVCNVAARYGKVELLGPLVCEIETKQEGKPGKQETALQAPSVQEEVQLGSAQRCKILFISIGTESLFGDHLKRLRYMEGSDRFLKPIFIGEQEWVIELVQVPCGHMRWRSPSFRAGLTDADTWVLWNYDEVDDSETRVKRTQEIIDAIYKGPRESKGWKGKEGTMMLHFEIEDDGNAKAVEEMKELATKEQLKCRVCDIKSGEGVILLLGDLVREVIGKRTAPEVDPVAGKAKEKADGTLRRLSTFIKRPKPREQLTQSK